MLAVRDEDSELVADCEEVAVGVSPVVTLCVGEKEPERDWLCDLVRVSDCEREPLPLIVAVREGDAVGDCEFVDVSDGEGVTDEVLDTVAMPLAVPLIESVLDCEVVGNWLPDCEGVDCCDGVAV